MGFKSAAMAFQREKRLTRKEKQALHGVGPRPPATAGAGSTAIACAALRPGGTPWTTVRCAHGSAFQSCVACVPQTRVLLADHDRNGSDVRAAAAWH